MKLTSKTFSIMKNFSSINQSLYVFPGNRIKTVSETKTAIAEAEVQEMFPREFGIYDLNQFLGIVSLLEEPDIDFDTTNCTISGQNGAKSEYFYADKNTFRIVPSLEAFKLPDEYVSFSVTDKVIKGVMQAANVLQLPEIAIVGDGETISIKAVNSKNKTTNTFCYDVGKTTKTFNSIFKVENLKIMLGSYDVTLSKQKMAQFTSLDRNLTYTIVNEVSSTFED